MQIDGNKDMPFSLYITSMRRRAIIASICAPPGKDKTDGEKILLNYKKQLAEKCVRETDERGELFSRASNSRASKRSANMG